VRGLPQRGETLDVALAGRTYALAVMNYSRLRVLADAQVGKTPWCVVGPEPQMYPMLTVSCLGERV
jgi:hypothetical protein